MKFCLKQKIMHDPISELHQLLSKSDTTLEEVLRFDSVVNLFNQSMPQLIQFFVYCADQLLEIAICSKDQILQFRAYNIIHSENSILLLALLHRKTISNFAEKYLFNDNPDIIAICRLANVIEICITDYFDEACQQFYFIAEFLKFVDNITILDFFDECLHHPVYGKNFVQWINDLDIDQRLMDMIESVVSNNETRPEFIYGIYRMLGLCFQFPTIQQRFLTPSRISIIIDPPKKESPNYIIDQYSKLILEICNEHTAGFIASYLNFFLDIVKTETDNILPYYINSFQILWKLYYINPDLCSSFSTDLLVKTAFRVITEVPYHSLALLVLSQFLIDYAKISVQNRDEILETFIPIAEFNLDNSDNVTLQAFIMKIMYQLDNEINWDNYDKERFMNLYRYYVDPVIELIEADYGGPVPPPPPLII